MRFDPRDAPDQTILMQPDFSGGMEMRQPADTQYHEGINVVCRDGWVGTRPGMRRHFSPMSGFLAGVTFGGFWFAGTAGGARIHFARSAWAGEIQGAAFVRLWSWDRSKLIYASAGLVYLAQGGYQTLVATTPALGADEEIEFVQMNNAILMFRGEDLAPLVWDGGTGGFVVIAQTGAAAVPKVDSGIFHLGRLWVSDSTDTIWASKVLDYGAWNEPYQSFAIGKGDGKGAPIVFPFQRDIILCFKHDSIEALTGIGSPVPVGAALSDFVGRETVDRDTGCVARRAIVHSGEDVWYLARTGIYSLARNMEDKVRRQPLAVSAPIQPWIDRINWDAASGACAAVHNNYVLFSVPTDGRLYNNTTLVYDMQAAGGAGAWVSVWQSEQLRPVCYFHDAETLCFLGNDHAVRRLFTNDPWDSEAPLEDTPPYSATERNEPGDLRAYESSGQEKVYRCLRTCVGQAPTDADYWEDVLAAGEDLWRLYDVRSEVTGRYFEAAPGGALRLGRCELMFQHLWPKISLAMLDRGGNELSALFADQEYRLDLWDIVATGWNTNNETLNFDDLYRRDYIWWMPASGFYLDADDGIHANGWTLHSLQWLPILVRDRGLRWKVLNTRGALRVVRFTAMTGRYRAGAKAVAG